MKDFKKMTVWKRSLDLILAVYRETGRFPQSEQYGLVQQLRRAAVSIACNLAEGSGRFGDGDFRRFVHMSLGSCSEVECLLIISREVKFLNPEAHRNLEQLRSEIGRMLVGLIRYLSRQIDNSR